MVTKTKVCNHFSPHDSALPSAISDEDGATGKFSLGKFVECGDGGVVVDENGGIDKSIVPESGGCSSTQEK